MAPGNAVARTDLWVFLLPPLEMLPKTSRERLYPSVARQLSSQSTERSGQINARLSGIIFRRPLLRTPITVLDYSSQSNVATSHNASCRRSSENYRVYPRPYCS